MSLLSNQKIIIVILILLIIIFFLYYKTENFVTSGETIQAISSMYNANLLTATNIKASENITANNIKASNIDVSGNINSVNIKAINTEIYGGAIIANATIGNIKSGFVMADAINSENHIIIGKPPNQFILNSYEEGLVIASRPSINAPWLNSIIIHRDGHVEIPGALTVKGRPI